MNKLLDDYLCKKYPKIFVERNLSPKETCFCYGFEHGDGWFYLINGLSDRIQNHIDSHNSAVDKGWDWAVKKGKIPQVVVKQVKEKFGSLRFYYEGGDDEITGMVSLAEDLSFDICEKCGKMDNTIGRNKTGWIRTLCETHKKTEKDFHSTNDPELNEIWKKVADEEHTCN